MHGPICPGGRLSDGPLSLHPRLLPDPCHPHLQTQVASHRFRGLYHWPGNIDECIGLSRADYLRNARHAWLHTFKSDLCFQTHRNRVLPLQTSHNHCSQSTSQLDSTTSYLVALRFGEQPKAQAHFQGKLSPGHARGPVHDHIWLPRVPIRGQQLGIVAVGRLRLPALSLLRLYAGFLMLLMQRLNHVSSPNTNG